MNLLHKAPHQTIGNAIRELDLLDPDSETFQIQRQRLIYDLECAQMDLKTKDDKGLYSKRAWWWEGFTIGVILTTLAIVIAVQLSK